MIEPNHPEEYYLLKMKGEHEGKTGKLTIKKWIDPETKKWVEKVIKFEEDRYGSQ